jgi:hypothetical protein
MVSAALAGFEKAISCPGIVVAPVGFSVAKNKRIMWDWPDDVAEEERRFIISKLNYFSLQNIV